MWGDGAQRAQRGPPARAAAPRPVRRPRDPAGSGPRGPGSPDEPGPGRVGPSEGDITVGGAGQWRAGQSVASAPWRQGTRETSSFSAAGVREWQDTGLTFGALVALGAAEEGRRGSETSARPEAAEAPASWGARFLIEGFPS